jgi:putative solute:sodium symporter small subunit
VAYLLGGLFAGQLNKLTIIGFPLGYYIAAQGALIVFVIEIAVYARLMNRKDLEYGIREEA